MSTSRTRNQKSRGQVALEFMFFAMLTFVVFTSFLFMIRKEMTDLSAQRENKELSDVINRLREEIFLSSVVHDGYYRNFTLPKKINRKSYTLEITDGQIIGQINNSTLTAAVPGVVGNPQIGYNTINRTGGILYLN